MHLTEVIQSLNIHDKNIFPVPSIHFIVRLGKIPREEILGKYWFPIWRISSIYNEDQIKTVVLMLKKKFDKFAIAFENNENYLILSDNIINRKDADKIISVINQK